MVGCVLYVFNAPLPYQTPGKLKYPYPSTLTVTKLKYPYPNLNQTEISLP